MDQGFQMMYAFTKQDAARSFRERPNATTVESAVPFPRGDSKSFVYSS